MGRWFKPASRDVAVQRSPVGLVAVAPGIHCLADEHDFRAPSAIAHFRDDSPADDDRSGRNLRTMQNVQ